MSFPSVGRHFKQAIPSKRCSDSNKAQNLDQFRQAASLFHTPGHNLMYADIDGNIGYQTSGDVPIRKKGDGTMPVPGWTSEYDWTGFVPFDELPYTLNPAEGYIASVNNKIVGRWV